MDKANLSRRGFLASAGTVLASLTFSLASGPAAAFAQDGETSAGSPTADGGGQTGADEGAAVDDSHIVIVHTNDVHCAFTNKTTQLGYAKLSDYVADQRSKHGDARVTLVDAGDNIQGDINGSLSQGEYPARVIGACKYDVMTCGNHEFDYGMQTFFGVRQTEDTPYVCCNFVDAGGNRIFDAYRVFEYAIGDQTVRVAYVGTCTPSTLTASTPTSFKDSDGNYIYGFCGDQSGEALYQAIQTAVDEARSKGDADYVVLLAHLGQVGAQARWRSDTVVSKTRGIDLVLDGHSHEKYVQTVKNADGQDVVIAQAGTKFAAISRTQIDPAAGTGTIALTATGVAAELIESWDGSDPEIEALVEQLEKELAEKTRRVIGKSTVELRSYEDDHYTWAVRAHETNMGDLVADSMLYRASNMGKTCDLALVTGGGIRADIAAGDVTYGDCASVLTFNNQLACLTVTGQHILDMLEVGAMYVPQAAGRFIQASEGVTFTIRTDIPTPVVLAGDGASVEKYEGERRVKNVCLYGKPIEADKTYTLISSSYDLEAGGDCMPIPANVDQIEYLGLDVDALIEYIQVNLKGVIGEEYGNVAGAGRITITDHAEAVDPVDPDGSQGGEGVSPSTSESTATQTTTTRRAKKGTGGVPSTGDTSVEVGAVAVLGAGAVAAALLAE